MKIYNSEVILKTFAIIRYLRLSALTWPGAGASLALGLILLLYIGCGDDSNYSNPAAANTESESWAMMPLPNTEATFKAVRKAAPSNNCPHSSYYLASSNAWSIVNGSPSDLETKDIVEINEDCTFRSFACGTVGYIKSGGTSDYRGIVEVMMLGHLVPKSNCYALGVQSCAYIADGAGELRFTCQLLEPLQSQFVP